MSHADIARSPLRGPTGRGRTGALARACTLRGRRGDRARRLTLCGRWAKPPAPGPPTACGGMAARLLPLHSHPAAGPYLGANPHPARVDGKRTTPDDPQPPKNPFSSALRRRVRWTERAMLRGFQECALRTGASAGNLELGYSREGRSAVWPQVRWRRLVACPERALKSVQGLRSSPAPRKATTGVCRADVRAPELQRKVPNPPQSREPAALMSYNGHS